MAVALITAMRDIRYGLRVLARAPGVTFAAVLSLALGIGANLSVFSLINSTLLRSLPVRDPARLVAFHYRTPYGYATSFSYPDYLAFRAQLDTFEAVAAWESTTAVLNADDVSERVGAEVVSPEYPAATGLSLAVGRWPTPSEPAVVISENLWKRRFAGDPAILGRAIRVNGELFTIVGVAAPGFSGLEPRSRAALWAPLAFHAVVIPWGAKASRQEVERYRLQNRGTEWLQVAARLKSGVSVENANTVLGVLAARINREHPHYYSYWTPAVSPAGRGAIDPGTRAEVAGRMTLFFAIATLVLLSACANVANLLLARAASRRREFAIRRAVGAARHRLLRQFFTESLLLATAGGAAALLAALWGPSLAGSLRLPGGWSARDLNFAPDARIYLFALALALAAALACGIVPALRAAAGSILEPLRGAGPGSGAGRHRLRAALVIAQVGVSAILLVSAGLLLRSLENRIALDPGFTRQKLLLATFEAGADEARGKAFYRDLSAAASTLPGVQTAALSAGLPLDRRAIRWGGSLVEGIKADLAGNAVYPGYFATMGIPIVEGRGFTEADAASGTEVAIVAESMARRYWPGRSALGGRIVAGDQSLTVVGVARDSRHLDLRSLLGTAAPYLYVDAAQQYWPRMTLVLRTAAPAGAVLAALQREVRRIDPAMAPIGVRTAREHVNEIFAEERTTALLAAALGLLALVLSIAGIYGVVSYWVAERTHEIGIRMALGAQRSGALRLVLGRAAALAGAGIAAGLALAWILTRALSGMLFGVTARDPLTYAGAAVLLIAVALAASYVPARRATRVDPVVALRYE